MEPDSEIHEEAQEEFEEFDKEFKVVFQE